MFVIKDAAGRRIVMPRHTAEDAIEQIARAFVGRDAPLDAKARAWARLRDEQGYRIEAALPTVRRLPAPAHPDAAVSPPAPRRRRRRSTTS